MSPDAKGTPAQELPQRSFKRNKVRSGTFIEPQTGERSHRAFTLRPPPAPDGTGGTMLPFFRESAAERSQAAQHNVKVGACKALKWMKSPMGKGILKCTLAYTLASLWTFWTPLSDSLGKPDGKHVVATITVYFHPARSTGSMIEAVLVAIVAVTYAELISILSMSISVFFGRELDMVALAHVLVLIIFIGGGFGFIGWVKQKLNNPLVNVGSTLASMAIIGVVTKENAVVMNVFSNQKIFQIFQMLVFGITTTTAVNLLVWRVSSVALLRESMIKASTSLGAMLAMTTTGFLEGSEESMISHEFTAASLAYSAVYPQLAKNLREAKFERYLLGHEKIYQLDRAVVKSLETLAQSIGGLRSAANTQFALIKENIIVATSVNTTPETAALSPTLKRSMSSILKSGQDRLLVLSSIEEGSEEGAQEDGPRGQSRSPTLKTASDIFAHFIALLGPPMKSLAYTLSEVLHEHPFGSAPEYEIKVNDQFRHSLFEALRLFNSARANALQELYRQLELCRTRSIEAQADFEEVAAACGHFTFSLQSFGEEMLKYLDVLEELKYISKHCSRSWHWLDLWRKKRRLRARLSLHYDPEETEVLVKPVKKTTIPKGIPDAMVERRDTYNWQAQPEKANTVGAKMSMRLLKALRILTRDEIRFGLKVGLGATLWAMFAFIEETRDVYNLWRGEWGLLSFMIVCSMTVGASNTTGWSRFVATLIGAGVSLVNWTITDGNALGLVILGWMVAFWSFWMIVECGQAPLGRTTMLAYNVTTLYAYSLSQKVEDPDDDEGGVNPIISEIIVHRAVAVTAGLIWGLVVCRVIWPISARRKFKEGLSVLYLQMGLIWKRGPLAILLRSDCSRSYLKSGEQAALQKYATRLESLRKSAASEFELRGPFPSQQYGRLMHCTNRILDAFYTMSLVTQRKGRLTEGERALLQDTAHERQLLCDRICHVFQVLASSIMLECPLTNAVPDVMGTRDNLLGKIYQFRKMYQENRARSKSSAVAGSSSSAAGKGSDSDEPSPFEIVVEERNYGLLYAYALVTGQVAQELKEVERELEELYGMWHEDMLLSQ